MLNHLDLTPTLPEISIIIPCFNEEESIGNTLKELCEVQELEQAEIIVIDDGSTDRTAEKVRQFPQIFLVKHPNNRGYGASIITGTKFSKGKYIFWYDADGQHRPGDLLKISEVLIKKELDYVIGVRDSSSYQEKSRTLGKAILKLTIMIVTGRYIEDFNSGLRGFKREVISRYLHLLPKGFSASTTTTLLMMERGYFGEEVPITTRKRVGTSTVKQIKDGFRTLWMVLRVFLLFKPMYFFGSIGLGIFLTGSIYSIIRAILDGRGVPVLGALVIILGIQTFFFGLIADQISASRREKFE